MLLLGLQQMIRLYEVRFAPIYVPKEFEDAIMQGNTALGIQTNDSKGSS